MQRRTNTQRAASYLSLLIHHPACLYLVSIFSLLIIVVLLLPSVRVPPKVPVKGTSASGGSKKVKVMPQEQWKKVRRIWNQTYKAPSFSPDEGLVNVFHDYVTFLIDQPDFCSRRTGRVLAVAGVITAIKNRKNRRFVRNTWGHPKLTHQTGIYPVFILGTSPDKEKMELIRKESQEHSDILQANFTDTYHNLTYKTLSLLEWMARRCRSPPYLLKIDDDVFVNPMALSDYLTLLPQLDPGPPRIMGKIKSRDPVLRKGKWGVTEEEFGPSYYPPFLGGPSYIVPSVHIDALLEAARRIRIFRLEDVYVTGLAAQKANVSHQSIASLTNSDSRPAMVKLRWESSSKIFQENIGLRQAAKSWNELLKMENITVIEPYDPSDFS